MGRPVDDGLDWFQHQTRHGKTIYILEQRYGNDGYAAWFKILEILATTQGHAYNVSADCNWEYLVATLRAEPERAKAIIDLLARLDAIDNELWIEHQVIWCQKLVDNFRETYRKRRRPLPTKPEFPARKLGFSSRKPEFPPQKVQQSADDPEFPRISAAESTQSRVEKRREEYKEDCPPPPIDHDQDTISPDNQLDLSQKDQSALSVDPRLYILSTIPHYPLDVAKDRGTLNELSAEFPNIDTLSLLRNWKTYLTNDGCELKKTSKARSQLRNQFVSANNRGKHQKEGAPSGTNATGRTGQAHGAPGSGGGDNGNGRGKYAGVGEKLDLGRTTQ
jgi:hypothetical protein